MLTLCLTPDISSLGFETEVLSPASAGLPLRGRGLTHRGLPASQTRRLIVSGSGVSPSATFGRRCFETSLVRSVPELTVATRRARGRVVEECIRAG